MIRPEIESDGYISSNNDDSSDGYISSNNDDSSDDVVVSSDSESSWSDNSDDSAQTIITTPPNIPQPTPVKNNRSVNSISLILL